MPTSLTKSSETDNRVYRSWSIGIYALPALLALALIGFLMNQPGASNWVSDAAQAEFVGATFVPDAAPTQLAQPGNRIQTVKAN